jgi:carboxyl-terminal processing protease
MKMTPRLIRWTLALSCALAAVPTVPTWAQVASVPAPVEMGQRPQVVSIDQLKTEAFAAARGGKFGRTNELLAMAAKLSNDPQLVQMAGWTGQFEAQRKEFAAERETQYRKAVEDVHKLLDAGLGDYAIDAAARAYSLTDDQGNFRKEKWVDDLVHRTVTRAEEAEKSEQWIKALRMYSDLSSVEPSNPDWKARLKQITRRVRLLAVYTPDRLREMQDKETKDREAADLVLRPEAATQKSATTKPAEDDANDRAFKIDWRETVKGVTMDMLREAFDDANRDYYRDVHYRDMTFGGLNGLRALVTTKGLETTFPGLADNDKRQLFTDVLDSCANDVKAATADTEEQVFRNVLATLALANRKSIEIPTEVLVSEFADGAFAELDPFSGVIWPTDMAEFAKTTQGEFEGVGIQIQNDDMGNIKIVTPIEDSPAFKAGIQAGSIITHIDGKSAKNISLNQAVKSITGPGGSTVRLTIRSESGETRDYALKRGTIKVASVKGWKHLPGGGWDYFVDSDQKIAYVRLTNFSRTTGDDINNAITALNKEGARGMILDLRNNPGGLLTEATKVSDRFLKEGTIVSTRADRETPNPPDAKFASHDKDEVEMPMVVLVNQYSASASEIVSGALKDLKRAMVVGERTFGKGSVQMLFPLDGRSALLKLTTSHYYLPSGRCLHREENSTEWGVDPDVKIEMTPEQMRDANEARQEQDILRELNAAPAESKQEQLNDQAAANAEAIEKKVKKDVLSSDPQLSAALLLLRLQLNGAQL